ncbi:MAG TPA: hypothetical protein VFH48_28745 [Chloroflexota bacterium]|nr:hypothetical protein [Chloroflexota bacterium]
MLAATGDAESGAIATAVEIDAPGATDVLVEGPSAAGDAAISARAVAVGVGARGASTRVVLV